MIKVLDKGYVKYISHMGDDNTPLEFARMSTGNETGVDTVKDDRLREYLWKNSHVSPFESCVLTVEMKLPLFVLRQLDRHRTLGVEETYIESYDTFRKYSSRNEFSGRYAEFEDEFYIPDLDRIKGQDKINKQGSEGELSNQLKKEFRENLECYNQNTFKEYEIQLDGGTSKELSRLFIMQNVYTKIRITASLLNWFNFLRLRLDEHAQWEVRQYAEAIANIIKDRWPKCYNLFNKHTLSSIIILSTEFNLVKVLINKLLDKDESYPRSRCLEILSLSGAEDKEAEKLLDKLGIKD